MADTQLQGIVREAGEQLRIATLTTDQEGAIYEFVKGRDVFVCLPTGSGKSICFAVLPLVFDALKGRKGSICLVVSPLTALMKDQVDAFQGRGLSAAFCGAHQTDQETLDRIRAGGYQLVYITPEALVNKTMYRDMLLESVWQENLIAYVIDESHCIKTWGEEFRTAFRGLGDVRSLMKKKVSVMALTATATKGTRDTIFSTVGMKNVFIVSTIPEKENIIYSVTKTASIQSVFLQCAQDLIVRRDSYPRLLIFCRTISDCANIYEFFKRKLGKECTHPIGAPDIAHFRLVDMYTSVTTPGVKEEIHQHMQHEDSSLRVLICTNAFGMGIDCKAVRSVVHWGPPGDMEAYVKEVGRGGRDGKETSARLCFDKEGSTSVEKHMQDYCVNETECRRKLLMSYFVDDYLSRVMGFCKCCDVCRRCCKCAECLDV